MDEYAEYRAKALAHLEAKYCLTEDDVDGGWRLRLAFDLGESPEEAIDQIGQKLGLTALSDWGIAQANRFMARFNR